MLINKKSNKSFLEITTVFKITLTVFLFILFLLFNKSLKAESDKVITFHFYDETKEVSCNLNEEITEIPTLTTLDFYDVVFEGWYEDGFYSGLNYFGKTIDFNTPTNLYAKVAPKHTEDVLNNYTFEDYNNGYQITSYTGDEEYLNIPSYFYEETLTPNLYEVKDVISIKNNTFLNNTIIKSIYIPKTIINIDIEALHELVSLMDINVHPDNPNYSSVNGILYSKDKKELLYFPKAMRDLDYIELNEGLEVIKTHSFYETLYLEKLILPSSLLEIETEAFINNSSLKSIVVKDGVLDSISNKAFYNNSNLELLMIPNTVTYVGKDAFSGSKIGLNIYYQNLEINTPNTWDSNWNSSNYTVVEDYNNITFDVIFKNHDGTIFDSQIVRFAESAIFTGENLPYKEPTLEYNYPFIGWDKNYEYVLSDLELFAEHRESPRYYTAIFHDSEGFEIGRRSLKYGDSSNNDHFMGQTKGPTAQYTYNHIGWDSDLEFIISDILVYPVFEEIINKYEVVFYYDDNESYFFNSYLKYGSLIELPSNEPLKQQTNEFNYIFIGWYFNIERTIPYDESSIVTEKTFLYPLFKEEKRTYNVYFYNENQLHDFQKIEYGQDALAPVEPEKASTGKFSYVFLNWDKSFLNVKNDLIIKAVYEEIIREYIVNFYSEGTLIDSQSIEYGNSAVSPTEPTKDNTAEYSYEFISWDQDFSFITYNLDVTAIFREIPNSYTVTYETNGGTLIESHLKTYNTYLNVPIRPTKTGHEFVGWYSDSEFLNSWDFNLNKMPAEDLTLYAKWEINKYKISFISNGGSSVEPIIKDFYSLIESPADPTRIGYTFNGWYKNSDLTIPYTFSRMPAENTTLYAGWEINQYTITFITDGSEVLPITANYNESITLLDSNKTGYRFIGWYLEPELINNFSLTRMPAENLTIYAKFTINSYTITFNSNGGNHISPLTKDYNEVLNLIDADRVGYSFTGWYTDQLLTNKFTSLTMPAENTTLYAGWEINQYTITFITDGSEVLSIIANYNESITLLESNKIGYRFIGWYLEPELINNFSLKRMPAEDLTLYAKWQINEYTVTFYRFEEETINNIVFETKTITHGSILVLPINNPSKNSTEMYNYEFLGWSRENEVVTSDRNIYPIFKETLKEFEVNFYSEGVLINNQKVSYGNSAVAPDEPTKEGTAEYSYNFIGWNKDFTNITSDLDVHALYESILNSYTVTFYDDDRLTILDEQTIKYGYSARTPETPIKEPTKELVFSFSGWDKNFNNIEGDLDVYATYQSSPRKYTIKFYNEDNLIVTQYISYGESAIAPNNPTKQKTPEYSYEFIGWDKDYTNISSDLNIYAVYEEVLNSYTITFNTLGGTTIEPITADYGSAVIAPSDPERPGYTFTGWFNDIELTTSYTFTTMPAENTTLYAGWEINQYTITFITDGSEVLPITANYNENITLLDSNKTGYTFTGWYYDVELMNEFSLTRMPAEDLTLYAGFSVNQYTITFNTNKGDSLAPLTLDYDSIISKPIPTRTGYTFIDWYQDVELATPYVFSTMPAENITLYAKWEINQYTVTFYDDDETYLGEVVVNYLDNASFTPPTKSSNEQYDYEFSHWSQSVLNVKENLDVYAIYTATLRKYLITFYKNENLIGEENTILKSMLVEYGSSAVAPNAPTKAPTNKYTYLFSNWDKDFTNITSDLNIYPVFSENLREYTVKFILDDYITVISEVKVYYNENAEMPDDPIKESTPQYDYNFIGWSEDVSNITRDLNVYARFNAVLRTYTVKFYNGEEIIKTEEVTYGNSAKAPTNPTKKQTPKYKYEFIGWDEDFSNIVSDLNVYATYEEILRTYFVYFYDDKGHYLYGSVEVNYGEPAVYHYEPTKDSDEQYTYEFIGWDKDLSSIKETMMVKALYEKTIREYKVFFYNYGGTELLKEDQVPYGESATPPSNPTRESTEKYSYIFSGWSLDYTFVDGNMEVYALYDEVLNIYTITFYNSDLSIYETIERAYGSKINLPIEPTKESTNEFVYSFVGWYKDKEYLIPYDEEETVSNNLSFYPQFEESLRTYKVSFYNDGVLYDSQDIYYNGSANRPVDPTKESTPQYTYKFTNWDKEFDSIVSDLDVYAVYEEVLRYYTINFYNGGEVIKTEEVAFGSSATAPTDPVKEKTNKYEYIFAGWDKDFNNIVSNLNVYAIFNSTLRKFKVTFYNALNEVLKEEFVEYDQGATAPETPVKESTERYNYEFTRWDKSFAYVYNDLDIYPIYEKTLRYYTINFYNGEEVIKTEEVAFGNSATAPTDPTKESTPQYTYEFTGWDKKFDNIVSDLNVYAMFKEELRKYRVSFYDDDRMTILDQQLVNYNEGAIEPETPVKESSERYNYEFIGWSEDFSNIKEDLVVFAEYQESLKTFIVNFYDEDRETLLKTETVNYGSFATAPTNPTKESTEKYNYEFIGWSESFNNVRSNIDVYALFAEKVKKYTVNFYMDDEVSLLRTLEVAHNEDAIAPANPTKKSTQKFTYEFIGWDKEFNNITSDLNIYAKFSEKLREFTVKFYNDNNDLIKEERVIYGEAANPPANPIKEKTSKYSYNFVKWDKDFNNITSDLNLYPLYEEEINSYIVIFNDAYGNVYKKETLVYGTTITLPEDGPLKKTDEEFSYVFSGWDGYILGMTIREDLIFNPLYETTGVIYQITIIVDNRETTYELPYGEELPKLSELKESTNKYTYILSGALINGEYVKLENFPETVQENLEIELKYDSYINRPYYISYLNEINFKSIRSYSSLVEASKMLEELSVENYEELQQLFNEKVTIYNELVNDLNEELETVEDYEKAIFNGLLEISLSLQTLSYLVYLSMRKGFYYA